MHTRFVTFVTLTSAVLLCASAPPSFATDYYVASGVSNGIQGDVIPNAGANGPTRGTPGQPFQTIQYAATIATAGDRVIVRNGTYTETVVVGYNHYGSNFQTTHTGTSSAHIVFMAENAHHAKLVGPTSTTSSAAYYLGAFNVASADANKVKMQLDSDDFNWMVSQAHPTVVVGYIDIQDFDITSGGYNSLGIDCEWAHHVTITNNIVHDCPAGGIGMWSCDYSTITKNTVRNNCRTSTSNSSAISLLESAHYDRTTNVTHESVTQNFIYGNYIAANTTTTPGGSTLSNHTDGNGIIVDTSPFQLGTLIENNEVDSSGGSGIQLDGSVNVTIYNNTLYGNNTDAKIYEKTYDTYRSEIILQANSGLAASGLNSVCKNITIQSNVLCPTTVDFTDSHKHTFGSVTVQDATSNSTITNNWFYKPASGSNAAKTSGLFLKVANGSEVNNYPSDNFSANFGDLTSMPSSDPKFVSSTDFELQSSSPLIGKSQHHGTVDVEGRARPNGGVWDLGADEHH